jgi:TPR repeat protein
LFTFEWLDAAAHHPEAMKHFCLAAERNLAEGQAAADVCFFLGLGCDADPTKAEKSSKRAAYQSDAIGTVVYSIAHSQLSK